ncbi:MAG: urea ABC transporter permease subunit UrtB [Halioglobus sp.]|nr:urea ABC transporter permease subunit UrtB [Halioglobus sp.]
MALLLLPYSVWAADLDSALAALAGASLSKVPAILEEVEAVGGEAAVPAFTAMLEGDLYYRRSDKRVVRAVRDDAGQYQLSDPLSGASLGASEKSALRKVKVSNRVRIHLRGAIARLTLSSEDPRQRLRAAQNLLERPDEDNLPLLRAAIETETDPDVVELLQTALALNLLQTSGDSEARLGAVETVAGSLQPAVRNQLQSMVQRDDDGNYGEEDAAVREAAQRALVTIDSRISFYGSLETVFFGLSLGSVLLLAALGLAITFGVMGVINMAHGELIMLGAYTTYMVQVLLPQHIEYSLFIAVPAAFVVSGLVGVLIERSVIRFLHGRPLETLLATFGISLILQQAVRTIFSPLNRQVFTPDWMSGSLQINSVFSLTYNRLYVFLFALVVFFVLQLVLNRTSLGLNVRAVSQNRSMARAIGVRADWVDALTFGLGSGIAGIAGVALSQLTNVGPNLGQAYIIDSFMVVVFGGVGNLWGTLVGALSLGVVNKFLEPVTGAVLAKILVLVFIILFIQKRPRGLFPQKGRAAE